MNRIRFLVSAAIAVVVTLGVFYFMYGLISTAGSRPDAGDPPPGIRFGPVDLPDQVTERRRAKPPPPPPPKEPPPPPKMEIAEVQQQVSNLPDLDIPNLDLPMTQSGGLYLGGFGAVDKNAEGDIIPLVRIQPMYPREAAIRRIEGWVQVEFTITPAGTVKDPRVVESEPPRLFDREAIRAILKWKFKPRVVDGQAVERRATQTIDFKLENV
ncbi:MAG: energy transducer TonB [Wenzhouxiangellaceae bacterium]